MGNSKVTQLKPSNKTKAELAPELLLKMHDLMVRTRVLEERLIKMYKQNDGFFWIGGPGEEAFNIPLGLQIKKGQGPKFDYFHGHYRSTGVLLAMGEEPIHSLRLMKNTATDPYSGGRNFSGHQSIQRWNVAPITSPIEVQYSIAPGTAMANKREKGDGVTIVIGGDAGTAEADFATCLVWSTRPINPLPILIIVTNNSWGISTPSEGQHGEKNIADRARAFGIPAVTIDGNNPEESYLEIQKGLEYCRSERKPYFIEAKVSRLYGHSSASGANFVGNEIDPIKEFEKRLENDGLKSRNEIDALWKTYNQEFLEAAQKVRQEPQPDPSTIYDYIYCGQKGKKGRFW